ncbi:hypothetical protein [Oceanirhabdus sp. W0125-5]|uniref:hypothetical protein n=1 Tax=Oceanirhabdus sp. W0125-5 TaxID=2999116 RepID=UPI0022F327B9|nr:hypothetical protein [Oceanirhabdus sp. W0125-5]WBW99660.1 hypothetical protein OW730_13190 [Oceanirhabdus sp. W0125-5]
MKKNNHKNQSRESYVVWRGIRRVLLLINAVVTIIVGSAGIYFTYTQTKIYDKQRQYMDMQLQPHYNMALLYENKNEKGIYTDNNFKIYNSGGNFYEFNCENIVFLKITYGKDRYMFPVKGFFELNREYFGEGDNLVFEAIGKNNNLLIDKLVGDIAQYAKNQGLSLDIEAVLFVKIEYQDIFGVDYVKYFRGNKGRLIKREQGEKIFELHNEYFEINGNTKSYNLTKNKMIRFLEYEKKIDLNKFKELFDFDN